MLDWTFIAIRHYFYANAFRKYTYNIQLIAKHVDLIPIIYTVCLCAYEYVCLFALSCFFSFTELTNKEIYRKKLPKHHLYFVPWVKESQSECLSEMKTPISKQRPK